MDIKELLGSVKKLPCPGGFSIDKKELLKPFEWDKAVVRSFCQGCGSLLEVDKKGADELSKLAKTTRSSWHGYYFQTRSCLLCQGKDLTVKLEKSYSVRY